MQMKKYIIGLVLIILVVSDLSGCFSNNGIISENSNIQILNYDFDRYVILIIIYDLTTNEFGLINESERGLKRYVILPYSNDLNSISTNFNVRKRVCDYMIERIFLPNVTFNNDYWGYSHIDYNGVKNIIEFKKFDLTDNVSYIKVSGTAKNIGNKFLNYSKIKVNFYNSANSLLASETYLANDIASGFIWDFEIIYYGKSRNDVDHIDFEVT
jgi:hypothetical protein